jgi:hypothetical protein
MQLNMFPVLGQASPPMSQLGWILSTQGSMSSLLVLLSAAAIFAGACYLIASQRSASVLAAYLILLPLPCLISICGWISGSAKSLSVISMYADIKLTTADIAGGLAASLMGLLIAFLVSAPTYFLLAYGLLTRTMRPPTNTARNRPASAAPPMPSLTGGLPISSPTL